MTRRRKSTVAPDPTVEPQEKGTASVVPFPGAPSFGLCAGVVADLEVTDKTVDPFTGRVITCGEVK